MAFDAQSSRRELKKWAIETLMGLSFQEAFQEQTLGNCGVAMIGTAIEAFLVGLFADGRELVIKANTFLKNLAIEMSEATMVYW